MFKILSNIVVEKNIYKIQHLEGSPSYLKDARFLKVKERICDDRLLLYVVP